MQQGEEHRADGGQPCPAVIHQQRVQFAEIANVEKAALGKIGHDDDGDDDLIGREAEDKRHENGAVQADGMAERIEKLGAVGQKAGVSHRDIGHQPDKEPCRSCHHRRPPEDKEGAVENGADKHLADLRGCGRGEVPA